VRAVEPAGDPDRGVVAGLHPKLLAHVAGAAGAGAVGGGLAAALRRERPLEQVAVALGQQLALTGAADKRREVSGPEHGGAALDRPARPAGEPDPARHPLEPHLVRAAVGALVGAGAHVGPLELARGGSRLVNRA